MTSPSQPSPHPIDRLYRFAASDRVLALVLGLTVLTLLLSVLLPQAPPETPFQSTDRWLAETASRYGGLGGAMQAAGLFQLWRMRRGCGPCWGCWHSSCCCGWDWPRTTHGSDCANQTRPLSPTWLHAGLFRPL
ncbi:MAG: hypothetical protein V9H69_17820 [Anaerolineae bacterium]